METLVKTTRFDWNDAARRARRPLLGPRIAAVLSTSTETLPKHTEDWFLHLNKVLKFPFDARIYYGAADFVQGSRLQVVALVSHDGLSDIIAKYKHGKRRGEISLSRLEVVGRQTEASQWLDAYRLWRDTVIARAINRMRHMGDYELECLNDPRDADDLLDELLPVVSRESSRPLLPASPFGFPPVDEEDDTSIWRNSLPSATNVPLHAAVSNKRSPVVGIRMLESPTINGDTPGDLPQAGSTPEVVPEETAVGSPSGDAPISPSEDDIPHLDDPPPAVAAASEAQGPETVDPPLRVDDVTCEPTAISPIEPTVSNLPPVGEMPAATLPSAAPPSPDDADVLGEPEGEGRELRDDPLVNALLELGRRHEEREAEIGDLIRELTEQASCAAARYQETVHLRDELARANEEAEALRGRVAELEREAHVYCDLADDAKHERDFHIAEHRKLRIRADSLAAQLADKLGPAGDDENRLPTEYKDIPAWVEEQLAGRLMLLPRALRGLAEAQFLDVGLVCRALLLLANEYRDMRRGVLPKAGFDAKLEELRLRYSKSISPSRAGEEGDEYFVNYPPGTLHRRFLEMHLRNNATTRYPPRCLAIYFLWDETTEQVAVGWLPGHLDLRSS